MAQYLDLNGLRTVVDNVKNIKFPVCLPTYDRRSSLSSTATVKNETVSSYTSIIYDTRTLRFLALSNGAFYTKWNSNSKHLSYDCYGTPLSTGVQPKFGYLYANVFDNTLQLGGTSGQLKNVANYVPSPTWTTVTTSPISSRDVVTKMEKSDTGNGTYLWRITVKNPNAYACDFLVQDVDADNFIQYGIYLEGEQSGTFTIELPKTTPNNRFYVTT